MRFSLGKNWSGGTCVDQDLQVEECHGVDPHGWLRRLQ